MLPPWDAPTSLRASRLFCAVGLMLLALLGFADAPTTTVRLKSWLAFIGAPAASVMAYYFAKP
jgi:hypothetical protein